ncbi:CrcB family protein [Sinomonas mesophila]|uniref:CrcB family protein n=1 Tax=Sinomonas mesophila TaxID=1531955 RepID=UPI00098766D3
MTDPQPRPAPDAGPAHDGGPPPSSSVAPSRLPPPRRPARAAGTAALALVFVGGVAGTLCRWVLGETLPAPGGWPLPTLLINLAGAVALGALLESLARRGPDAGARRLVRLGLGTGFLGAFTTYSALALDGMRLLLAGRVLEGAGYLAATVLGGAAATLAGVAGAAWLHRGDRRGLAAEAHAAVHPRHTHPLLESAPGFGNRPTPRGGADSETGGTPSGPAPSSVPKPPDSEGDQR